MKKLIVVTGPNCMPCKRVKIEVEEFTDDFPQARVEVVDASQSPDVAERLGVMSVPTLVLVDNQGQVLKRSSGFMNLTQIKAFFCE